MIFGKRGLSTICSVVLLSCSWSSIPDASALSQMRTMESEPNGRFAIATPLAASMAGPVVVEGRLNPRADGRDWDFDYYTFTVAKERAVSIVVSDHGPVAISVDLFNTDGTSGFLRQGQSYSGTGAKVLNFGLKPGRYFVRVYETVRKEGKRVRRRAKAGSGYLLSLRLNRVDGGTSWHRDGARILPF